MLRRKRILRATRSLIQQITPPIIHSALGKVAARARKPRERRNSIEMGGRTLRVHPDSYWTLAHFYGTHAQSTEQMGEFLKLTQGAKRLLDLGALHGVFALTFAARGGTALAVEASPIAFALLLYNIHANPDLAIKPIECAVSDRTGGELGMQLGSNQFAVATLGDRDIAVPRMTGDDICQRNAFEPDIIKVDIEGHEAHALAGLHRVINVGRPTLFLETHPGLYEVEHLDAELKWLSTLGYRSVSGPAIETIAGISDVPAVRTVLASG